MPILDRTNERYTNAVMAVREAAQGEDAAAFDTAMLSLAQEIEQSIMSAYEEMQGVNDTAVLAARGVRQLTGAEMKYYKDLNQAFKSPDPQMALKNLGDVMPLTIVNQIFEDIKSEHPLLEMVNFNYGKGVTEWLINVNERQMATWSAVTEDIAKELSGAFKKIRISQNKLSAYLPIAKSMLDLGPEWLDRYVRAVLSEALAIGLEDGIINGKGQTDSGPQEPIGMIKDMKQAVDQSTGYKDKEAVKVTALDSETMGDIVGDFTLTEGGTPRLIKELVLVVNPTDYFKKIVPATTLAKPDGTYERDILPIPCKIIQSTAVPNGKAILGDAKRYVFVGGIGKDGFTDFSDHYRFLEDERVYITKLYGHGTPVDNNCFAVLDISELKPLYYQVQVVNSATATNLEA